MTASAPTYDLETDELGFVLITSPGYVDTYNVFIKAASDGTGFVVGTAPGRVVRDLSPRAGVRSKEAKLASYGLMHGMGVPPRG